MEDYMEMGRTFIEQRHEEPSRNAAYPRTEVSFLILLVFTHRDAVWGWFLDAKRVCCVEYQRSRLAAGGCRGGICALGLCCSKPLRVVITHWETHQPKERSGIRSLSFLSFLKGVEKRRDSNIKITEGIEMNKEARKDRYRKKNELTQKWKGGNMLL